jgi:hypothetical protein
MDYASPGAAIDRRIKTRHQAAPADGGPGQIDPFLLDIQARFSTL